MRIDRTELGINSGSSTVGLVLHGDILKAHVSGSLRLKMSTCLPVGGELSHRTATVFIQPTPTCPSINASP